MTTKQRIWITPTQVELNGTKLPVTAHGGALLTELYRQHVNDYPKFFKMDELSRLGFVAAELLLQAEGDRHSDTDDRAVSLFNRCSSLCNDRKYQATIADKNDYFPSPSIFVYTLPNIVTGEIAIRNRYYGETSFYVLAARDYSFMQSVVEASFRDGTTRSALFGWIDCEDHDHFEAYMELVVQ